MQDFRNLLVWQKAHQLALRIYKTTGQFPRREIYGLTNQMRRCCVSIAANIAEGCGRGSDADFCRFLQMSFGSASELDYELLLSFDLGFLSEPDYLELARDVTETKRMLGSLLKRVKEPDK